MDREDIQVKVQRMLRKQKYKQLLEEGAQLGLRAETADPVATFEAVTHILEASNVLQSEGRIKDRAEATTEVLMDAQVVKMSHDVVHAAMQRMGNSEFSDDELVGAILSKFDVEQGVENWDKLTRDAAAIFRMSKHNQSLYGTFESEPEPATQKEVKQRAQRQRTDFGQAKKPDTVDKLQRQEKSAQKLNLIFNQIVTLCEQRRAPLPYYELITDPQDFMTTVDNAFQISFLIRDGKVALLVDENHEPLVRPTSEKENEQAQRMNETTQAILGLNPKKWRDMIERYEVDEPMLILNRDELNATQLPT
ncbi:EP300-interacting inhibitor of differentiation 3 [Toxorhynchites rutilus septentrionalis]|uniref:EP300-interacting inhibitor of differentiation 3 n=1 Tax=Toxorhynchites rutilus septentrionalis TaxID=329112 RepID=UPI002478F6CC|nr:EP300-interacting inhibitor of differentiation 3 [Toxorhynchites rutilus septentrionalis]